MLVEILIILILSCVQSIFGVGLLVFGTPSLILLGYSFETTLTIVLPSSIAISGLQYHHSKGHIESSMRFLSMYGLPALILGLLFILNTDTKWETKGILAGVLIFSGLLKMIPSFTHLLDKVIHKAEVPYLILLGFIHGVTNLGGGLLTLYSSCRGRSKTQVRGIIAFGYLLFGIIQLGAVLIHNIELLHWKMLLYPVFSILIFHFLGSRVFKKISEKIFLQMINMLILVYGVLLLLS